MDQFSKPTYSEKVARLITQRIKTGKLRGGTSISEASMAEECGISRAPVREALHHLEAEGLLMSHPKRGKCVTLLTADDIRHNYELSAALEGSAAEKAADGLPEETKEKLASLIESMREALKKDSTFDEHAYLGTQFHETILTLSDNPLLRSLATRFSRVISKYLMYQYWRTLYTPAELFDRHNRIYEALCHGSREEIRQTIAEHYAESAERLAQFCDGREPETRGKKAPHFPEE